MKKIILAGALAGLVLFLSACSLIPPAEKRAKVLTPEEAKAAAEKFINENLLPSNIKATINNAALEGGVYNINLDVGGKNYTSYMTKDGSKFFQEGIDMEDFADQNQTQAQIDSSQVQAPADNVPKSDKPKVELFVMTHCPYGLQAEKGFLPAVNALGDKIDARVRFVHYFLHGEEEERETYNQVCLREEQADKFNDYLSCFIAEGDGGKCAAQTGVDKAKLENCLASKSKEYYSSDSALSRQYGVQGSPTLVINGVQSSAGRDSAGYLAGICAAFNNTPAECSSQLSSDQPATGFGASAAPAVGSAASCATPVK